jgi:6-phosphogluconolactonase
LLNRHGVRKYFPNCERWANKISPALLLAVVLPASMRAAGLGERTGTDRSPQGEYLVYLGTYTNSSKGIYVCRFNARTGRVGKVELAAETVNPSFLTILPNGRFLYAVNELEKFEGQPSGAVSAFSIDRGSGKLTPLNQLASRGTDPCYISVDHTGKYVFVANYSSGSVAVFPILENGHLGKATAFVQHTGSSVNPMRQAGPHAHSVGVSPDNGFALSADLGLDEVLVSRFDASNGTLTPNNPPFAKVLPGSGPRHFVFSPSGTFVYVVSEMGSTVTVFSYNRARGALRRLQTISTLPKSFKGESTGAEVQIATSGKFLYASNRGNNTIAVFAIDPQKGTLSPVEYVPTQGKTPRMFQLDPTGSYLFAANQDSNNIVIFRIDQSTGRLTPTDEQIKLSKPVCVEFTRAKENP